MMANFNSSINNFFKRWTEISYDYSIHVLIIFVVLMLGTGAALTKLTMDMSAEARLHSADPVRVHFTEFRQRFGRDDTILISIPTQGRLDDALLKRIAEFQSAIEKNVPHLSKVTSVVNARYTYGDGDELVVATLLENWPNHRWQPGELQTYLLKQPNYRDKLLSADGKHTAVVVELDAMVLDATILEAMVLDATILEAMVLDATVMAGGAANGNLINSDKIGKPTFLTQAQSDLAVKTIKQVIAEYSDLNIATTGTPVVQEALNRRITHDSSLTAGGAVLITILFLVFFFRRISGVIMPLMVIISAILTAVGLMALTGTPYTLTTSSIGPILIAVGVADAVHILTQFYRNYEISGDKRQAIINGVSFSAPAVLLTSVTTASGFLSFLAADLVSIVELGIFTAIAVGLALLFTTTLIPACIASFPIKQHAGNQRVIKCVDEFTVACGDFACRYPRAISIIAITALVSGIYGATHLRFSDDIISNFPDEEITKQDLYKIDKAFNGSGAIEIVIDSGESNGIKEPEFLQRLERASERLSNRTITSVKLGETYSVLNILKETHRALNENRDDFYSIPKDKNLIAQELLLFEMSERNDLLKVTDSDFRFARLTLRISYADSVVYYNLLRTMEQELAEVFAGTATVSITGATALVAESIPRALSSMMKSYAIALVIISLLMIAMVGRWDIGLLSIIPNLLPIVIILNLMVLFDWPLDQTTISVGAIALGIVVDDTLHFLYHYKQYWQMDKDARAAIQKSFRGCGSALFITTAIYATAAADNTLSSMTPIIIFGVSLSSVTVLALLSDLIVTPALLFWLHGSTQTKQAAAKAIGMQTSGDFTSS